MITQSTNKETDKVEFIFTGKKDIYNYIHSFFETRETLILVKTYIDNYENAEKAQAIKILLKDICYYDIIMDAIDKMMTSQSVSHKCQYGDNLYYHFEMLFLNQ
jgi:hypothetical protein